MIKESRRVTIIWLLALLLLLITTVLSSQELTWLLIGRYQKCVIYWHREDCITCNIIDKQITFNTNLPVYVINTQAKIGPFSIGQDCVNSTDVDWVPSVTLWPEHETERVDITNLKEVEAKIESY